ncbi:hypothetical protein INS49_011439 [Diaporthe citri]|uniref:uncharacterized protein n=1 Tax=Diaporthe citri TaxID=83186 RepID=UPI001C7FCCC6|nr:uncharacterized protein INS49_011439 [Diaporthe citri]KAG6360381.1 hypothetical protein INS49_011439 [Diaporthe citri]
MGQTTEPVPHSTYILDESSDDEIKYENAPKTVISDDALEAGMEEDTSDDDTGSGGDDDEALESTPSRGADTSPRQLFHPPEESDYGDETDDDDGTVSSSSSSESSPAADEEPMVALPSANIQHQQDYPEHILKTAKSGRPYHAWFESGSEDVDADNLVTGDIDVPARPAAPSKVIQSVLNWKKKIYNVKVLSDRARGSVKAPKPDQQQNVSRTTGDNSLEEASQLNARVYQPSEIHSLEMASKDRAYKVIRGKDGESISMCGALIPEGYDLDRALILKVKHRGELLNDNQDGEKTFPGSPPPVGEWAASAAGANSSGQSKKRQLSVSDINEESRAQRRRYERNEGADNEEQAGVEKKLVTFPLPLPKRTTRASDSPTRRNTSPEPQMAHSKSFPSMSSSALVMAGQQTSDELLEMEDWEVAPGRIRDEGVDQLDNIAFSKSYLENNQSIPIAADVSFRVDTIKSGHKLEFEVATSRSRYCSVASGKLRVSIAGQAEFVIGPHGVFKIKPGVKAWAQNRLYIDSVVHVVSVEDGA